MMPDHYVLTHVLGSILGLILAIFGTFALGAYLAGSRAGRLGLLAMVSACLLYSRLRFEVGACRFTAGSPR
jgi:hypothetical protein